VPSVLWYCWLGLSTRKNRRLYNLYCVVGMVDTLNYALSRPISVKEANRVPHRYMRYQFPFQTPLATIRLFSKIEVSIPRARILAWLIQLRLNELSAIQRSNYNHRPRMDTCSLILWVPLPSQGRLPVRACSNIPPDPLLAKTLELAIHFCLNYVHNT